MEIISMCNPMKNSSSKKVSLKDLFENYRETSKQNELDWGPPQGQEQW
jgi:hypothetical protein